MGLLRSRRTDSVDPSWCKVVEHPDDDGSDLMLYEEKRAGGAGGGLGALPSPPPSPHRVPALKRRVLSTRTLALTLLTLLVVWGAQQQHRQHRRAHYHDRAPSPLGALNDTASQLQRGDDALPWRVERPNKGRLTNKDDRAPVCERVLLFVFDDAQASQDASRGFASDYMTYVSAHAWLSLACCPDTKPHRFAR